VNIYEFMGSHPVLTFVLAFVAAIVACEPFRTVRRWLRSRDIQKHGWPSAPMDADGDIVRREP